MRLSRLGNVLVFAGAGVGVATAAGIASGYEIALSPAMTQLIIYKGFAAAAVGLILAGSWMARRGRQQEAANEAAKHDESNKSTSDSAFLGSGMPPFPSEDDNKRSMQHVRGSTPEQ